MALPLRSVLARSVQLGRSERGAIPFLPSRLARRPNGLELSCPAEAGTASRTLRAAGRRFKKLSRPSPPGQLQRVVGRLTRIVLLRT